MGYIAVCENIFMDFLMEKWSDGIFDFVDFVQNSHLFYGSLGRAEVNQCNRNLRKTLLSFFK